LRTAAARAALLAIDSRRAAYHRRVVSLPRGGAASIRRAPTLKRDPRATKLAQRDPRAQGLSRRAAMRLPDEVYAHAGGYMPAADLSRLAVVSTSTRGAVATAVAIALRRPGGTTRDLYFLERLRAGSSRVATCEGEARFVTRDGQLVEFRDPSWSIESRDPSWSIASRMSGLGNARVVCVSVGHDFVCAVTDQSTVWSWGNNAYGQLGDRELEQRSGWDRGPAQIENLSDVATVACGVDYAWIATHGGEAFSWGTPLCGNRPA